MIINATENNIRIDKYLIDKLDISRSKLQKMINNGNILVNGNIVKNSYIVKLDDEISIDEDFNEEIKILPENIPLDIIYEDEYLLVVNKPSGMVVHPAPGNYSGTLVNALIYHCNNLSKVNSEIRPGIVHRIDADTSGLLVVAKNDDVHNKLAEQIKKHTVVRKYIALVWGVINEDSATIDAPIGRDKNNRKKMCITADNSKEAITHIKVLKRYNNATLIECKLETGRTHQIRVHMEYFNHPIIGDNLYGKNNCALYSKGQLLHAYKLTFVHPTLKKEMTFTAPLPKYFQDIIDKLK